MGSARVPYLRCGTASACAALLATACASQRPDGVRTLATARYAIRAGGQVVGEEHVTLSTLPDFGKLLASEVTRRRPSMCQEKWEIRLAPDWSIRSAHLTSFDATGALTEWSYRRQDGTPAAEVRFRPPDRSAGWTETTDAPYVHPVSAALGLVLARSGNLQSNGPPVHARAVVLGEGHREFLVQPWTAQRAPDRGRRIVLRFRLEWGAWAEIETDRRGLPWTLEAGDTRWERLAPEGPVRPEDSFKGP